MVFILITGTDKSNEAHKLPWHSKAQALLDVAATPGASPASEWYWMVIFPLEMVASIFYWVLRFIGFQQGIHQAASRGQNANRRLSYKYLNPSIRSKSNQAVPPFIQKTDCKSKGSHSSIKVYQSNLPSPPGTKDIFLASIDRIAASAALAGSSTWDGTEVLGFQAPVIYKTGRIHFTFVSYIILRNPTGYLNCVQSTHVNLNKVTVLLWWSMTLVYWALRSPQIIWPSAELLASGRWAPGTEKKPLMAPPASYSSCNLCSTPVLLGAGCQTYLRKVPWATGRGPRCEQCKWSEKTGRACTTLESPAFDALNLLKRTCNDMHMCVEMMI